MTSRHVPATTHTESIKTRFARRFLTSFLKLKKTNATSSSSSEISRSHRIKVAAYISMARAVGSGRAWSRALLLKLRNKEKLNDGVFRKRCLVLKKNKKKRVPLISKVSSPTKPSGADKLRKLVPGGDSMDICSLLEETAHYVKCLATQVKVMQRIADFYDE